MTPDVIALRAHLVAEVEGARRDATYCQRRAHRSCADVAYGIWRRAQWFAEDYAREARTATDAWLAADARLRALDGLIACYDSMARPHEQAQDACQPPKPTTV